MRILLFLNTVNFAGTERHVVELGSSLLRLGIDVAIACAKRAQFAAVAEGAGTPMVHLSRAKPIDVPAIVRLARFLRGNERAVVHCHNGQTALQATIAKALAGRGCVVLTQHFLQPTYASRQGAKKKLSDALHRWVDRRIDHTLAISDAVRRAVRERGEAEEERVTRVHNGISVSPASASSQAETREGVAVAPNVPLIVCAARLEEEKRIEVLIDAMHVLLKTQPTAQCIVAGQGDKQEQLQRQIDRLEVGDNVRLLGFRTDVKALIAAADVLVLPAEAEPFGLVVLEAMEAGVPVIASDAGGPREIVVPGETGWLVPPNDAPALATAILAAVADPERARAFGAAGRERLLQHFTAERMARETIAVYERALAHAEQRR
jgi:glycosyltransferase involved in cell wall biosynthesis